MGLWKTTTEVMGALEDDLTGRIDEVAGEAGTSLDSAFDSFRRARAPSIWNQGDNTASLGVWMQSSSTGSASQKERRWKIMAVIDYTYRGQDPTAVAEQVELVVDAILRVVDDMVERDTIVGSGEEQGETVTVHDIDEMVQEAAGLGSGAPYLSAARIMFPVLHREVLP